MLKPTRSVFYILDTLYEMLDTGVMLVDGKAIASDIKEELKKEVEGRKTPPTLFIFSVGNNPVSEKFLSVKKRFARDVGIPVIEKKFEGDAPLEKIKETIIEVPQKNAGIIVQLPLPKSIDAQKVLNAIPPTHDVDVLSEESFKLYAEDTLPIVPPVVGATKEILFRHNVFVGNKNVVVVGKGRLVGRPVAVWFKRHESRVESIDEHTPHPERRTLTADIIVSGAGTPHLIMKDMIKDGVVLIDAGTSEVSGKLMGDIDPSCAEKASLYTPVPGGVGPVTVAMLFKNLLELTTPPENHE